MSRRRFARFPVLRFLPVSAVLAALTFASACQDPGGAAAPAADPRVVRGKAVFQANCTACHNSDPAKPGTLGPDIAGSSRELIEARVLHAAYPPGYTPKRKTRAMGALPQLKGELDPLYAFLNSKP